MKKVILLSLFFLSVIAVTRVSAQHKIGLGAGLGVSRLTGDLGEGGSFGLNYYLEGKYYLTEKLAAGLEYNSAAVGYANEDAALGVSFYGNQSFFLKGEYFLTKGKVRPYAGLALGLARLSTPELTISDGTQTVTYPSEGKTNFGVSPRLGLMLRNFGMEFAYNIAGKTPNSTIFNVATSNQPFNFWSVNLKYTYPFTF